MLISHEQARAHERKLHRLLPWYMGAWLLFGLGIAFESLRGALLVGLLVGVVAGFRLLVYTMTDLRLRGKSELWALVLGMTPIGLLVWLLWRRLNPIPTRL
jgi:hypothetical protein